MPLIAKYLGRITYYGGALPQIQWIKVLDILDGMKCAGCKNRGSFEGGSGEGKR
jgi:hypothetical protein